MLLSTRAAAEHPKGWRGTSRKRFAWVLNLDAELELARPGYTPRVRLLAQLEQHGADSRRLLAPDDVLVGRPGVTTRVDAAGLTGRAWCPTPLAIAALRAAGATPEPHPPEAVLRRVNHRKFAFELGGGLDGQQYFEARAPLEALLRDATQPWLLKRPLAFAGRGQQRAYRALTEKEWTWVDASLKTDGLIVEPLIEPTLEVSLHGFVWRDGRCDIGRACVQEVTDRGVFRGVRLARSGELGAEEERALVERGEGVAAALGSVGYFGPFGIDAYRYRGVDGVGRSGFCALGEINARYTMGFLTGFPRHPSELSLE